LGQAGEHPTIVSLTASVWHSPGVAEGAADLLTRVPIFSDLDRKERERIAASMKQRTFNAGDAVTSEGQSGIGFFVIESGEATVTVGGDERRRLGPGDYFGEVALLNESPRTATITADTELRCFGLTSWEFRPLVETHSSIAWKLLQAMSKTYQSPA
jgi:CRP-like cAMP-binding protein